VGAVEDLDVERGVELGLRWSGASVRVSAR
jgi:hypothetical protein